MIPGYLVKAAGNGFVVLREAQIHVMSAQGPMVVEGGFSVSAESSWVFGTIEEVAKFLDAKFKEHRGEKSTVLSIAGNPPAPETKT